MSRMLLITTVALVLFTSQALAAETVGVPGSQNRFETVIESKIQGKPVKMQLTGTAMRKRLVFNVYAVGSYVQDGAKVKTPEELAALDAPKQMHLIMERDVAGTDVADAFKGAIRANYPEPEFEQEIAVLSEYLGSQSIQQGDHIWLTHVPKVGLHVTLVGKAERLIKNPKFARAVWDIYFGKNNLGEPVKKSLSSRL